MGGKDMSGRPGLACCGIGALNRSGLLLMSLLALLLGGCREDVPQTELDRFVAEHRELPPAAYEDSLRSIIARGTSQTVFAHYELGNLFYQAAGETIQVRGWQDGAAPALLDTAIMHFESAVTLDTTFVQAYVNLGSVWDDLADQTSMANLEERRLREERLSNAEKMYNRALTFAPYDEKALCNLGALNMKRQKTSEAVAYFQRALAVNPHSALAHYNLAIAFAEAKIYREAIREWEAAIDADPDGDIGERSRANIEIVKDLLEQKVPDKVGGGKSAASQ